MAQLLPYIRIIQRGWWIIALAALASFNVALFNSYNTTPMYRARAQFLVSPGPTILAGASDDLVRSIEALDKRSIVSTYAEILGSTTIYEETLATLQIDPSELSGYERTAVVLPDASVLQLTIEGPHPDIVALLANQVGQRAINHTQGLYLAYDISVLDSATTPSSPFSPIPTRDSAIALILGGAVGILLVLAQALFTSPLVFIQQQIKTDRISTAYTSRHIQQLVTQTIGTTDSTALALVKINNLAELKAELPQPAWQELQQQIVATIRQELRGKDMVGHWDDTTFALLLPNCTGATAVATLTTLYNSFLNPLSLTLYTDPILLDAHIGITTANQQAPPQSVIETTQQALTQSAQNTPPIAIIDPPQATTTAHSSPQAAYPVASSS